LFVYFILFFEAKAKGSRLILRYILFDFEVYFIFYFFYIEVYFILFSEAKVKGSRLKLIASTLSLGI